MPEQLGSTRIQRSLDQFEPLSESPSCGNITRNFLFSKPFFRKSKANRASVLEKARSIADFISSVDIEAKLEGADSGLDGMEDVVPSVEFEFPDKPESKAVLNPDQ